MNEVVDGLEPVDGKHTVRVCIGAQVYEIGRDAAVALELSLGCAVTPALRAQLEAAADRRSAAALVLRYLRGRPRTEHQVRAKLRSRGVREAAIDSVIADLVRQGVVDDARYAVAFVAVRQAHRPMGAARLQRELVARGVPRPLAAAEAGRAATREGGELGDALAAARPRVAAARRLGGDRGRRRLTLFLRRRGFGTSVALAACRALLDVAPHDPVMAEAAPDAHAPPSDAR